MGRKQKTGRYVALAKRLKAAEAKSAARCLARIMRASDESWHAAAWLLERRHGYRRNGVVEEPIDPIAAPRIAASAGLEAWLIEAIHTTKAIRKRATDEGSMVAATGALRTELELAKELETMQQAARQQAALMESPKEVLDRVVEVFASLPEHYRRHVIEMVDQRATVDTMPRA